MIDYWSQPTRFLKNQQWGPSNKQWPLWARICHCYTRALLRTQELLESAYLASLNSSIKTEIQILFKKFLKMYERTHSVFFMPYCIQSHRIKHVEFSLQNRDITISKPKAFLFFFFLKNSFLVPVHHLQMPVLQWWTIFQRLLGVPCNQFSFSLAAVILHMSGSLALGMTTWPSFLQWNATWMISDPWKTSCHDPPCLSS